MEVNVLIEEMDDGYREVIDVFRDLEDAQKKRMHFVTLGRKVEILVLPLK